MKAEKIEHLLDSLVFCGDCGAKMYLNKKSNKRNGTFFVYYCNSYRKKDSCTSHYIQENTLVDDVLQNIIAIFALYNLDKKEFRKKLLKNINAANSSATGYAKQRNEEINKMIKEIQTQESKLFDKFCKDEISLKVFTNITERLNSEIDELRNELGENLLIIDDHIDRKFGIKTFLQKLDIYSDHTKEEIDKFVLSQLIEKIDVYETKTDGSDNKEASTIDLKIHFEDIGFINIEELLK